MRSLLENLQFPKAGLTTCLLLWPLSAVQAQTASSASHLILELNRLEQVEEACRAGFVVQNQTKTDLTQVAFEFVLFNREGLIEQMSAFDFGTLNEGRTFVRRFDLKSEKCADVSRILVNRVSKCAVESGDAPDCNKLLKINNKTEIQFGN